MLTPTSHYTEQRGGVREPGGVRSQQVIARGGAAGGARQEHTGRSNRQWRLTRRPKGPPAREDFELSEAPIPVPSEGQMLTRTVYLSLDPYQWGYCRGGRIEVGDVLHGRTVSQVVASRMPGFAAGDFVFNTNGWQDYGLTGAGIDTWGYMRPRRLDPAVAPISTAVGVLGMLGLTAWSGVKVQCDPQPGETVVVSAASGGVGQCAGQIAKQLGCRVVGIAGAPDKVEFVAGVLGFDACVSYRSESFRDDLAHACPAGIDVYFENVGGAVFDAVLPLLNRGARISRCGLMSRQSTGGRHDDAAEWERQYSEGVSSAHRQSVVAHSLFVGDYAAEHEAGFLRTMGEWVASGKVQYKEDLRPGLQHAPDVFRALLLGGTFGKTLVGVSEDTSVPAAGRAIDLVRRGPNVLRRAAAAGGLTATPRL